MPRLLALVLLVLAGPLGAEPGLLPAAVAVSATALAVCLLSTALGVPLVAPTAVRTTIRERARRTAFLPQRDPDASGRPRPRAPGRRLVASAG